MAVPGNPVPSSDLCGYQVYTLLHTHSENMHKKINLNGFRLFVCFNEVGLSQALGLLGVTAP